MHRPVVKRWKTGRLQRLLPPSYIKKWSGNAALDTWSTLKGWFSAQLGRICTRSSGRFPSSGGGGHVGTALGDALPSHARKHDRRRVDEVRLKGPASTADAALAMGAGLSLGIWQSMCWRSNPLRRNSPASSDFKEFEYSAIDLTSLAAAMAEVSFIPDACNANQARGSLAEDAFKGSLGSQSFLRASEV
ncbi:hypothetical protein AK812_SmicGene37363 [Symbiodinium microadriaticum]|uniref:Uncharacterized protein n=1 Tax=Symbiodinium microadriaticum TaxID=2951 RepID=A0A1Q9CGG0_SYMMI|nr:hypothetical protein AK812_SmicGene37363 [Symbiodinium microadriaticum]